MARKTTPNVMDELLGNKGPATEAATPAEPEKKPKATRKRKTAPKPKSGPKVEEAAKEAVSPPSVASDEKISSDIKAQADAKIEMPKDKLTIYLDPEVNDDLEMLRLQLRKIIRPGKLHNVSKSTVTEAALAIALREFESNGPKAQIVAEIAKREASPQ